MSQKKKAARAKPKPSANPLVDKALAAHWKDAFERFEDAKRDEAARWDEQYEALGEILEADPPLYLAGGYANEKAFLSAALPGVDATGCGAMRGRHELRWASTPAYLTV